MKRILIVTFLVLAVGLGCPTRDVEKYLRDLKGPNIVAKREAIHKIGELNIKEAVPELVGLLNESSDEIELEVIEALGKIGDSAAVEPLIAKLDENNPLILEKTIEALGKIRDRRAVPALVSILEQKDSRSEGEVLTAIWALGNIGDRSAEPILNALLKQNNNKCVHYNVKQALKKISAGEATSIETPYPPSKGKMAKAGETKPVQLKFDEEDLKSLTDAIAERLLQRIQEFNESSEDSGSKVKAEETGNISRSAWVVEVSSCLLYNEAKNQASSLKDRGFPAYISWVNLKGKKWYRVRVGPYAAKEEAQKIKERIAKQLGIIDSWVHLIHTQTQRKMFE